VDLRRPGHAEAHGDIIQMSGSTMAIPENTLSRAATRGYTYRISSVAALGGFLFGFDTAIINGAIFFLRRQFRWTDFQTEVAAGSLLVGCAVGASVAGTLSDRFGRRKILLLAALIFAVSSIATAVPNALAQFCAARLVAGVAIGIASMVSPLYIAEASPAAMRGRLVSLNQLAIVLGILVSYLAGWALAGLGQESWRWMFAVAAIPSVLFGAALFTVPESPRWLLKENRVADALAILKRLGEPSSRADEIRAAIAGESASLRQLLEPGLRRPLAIGITLAVLQQVTGINTVLYYGSIIFTEHAGERSASGALWANVVIGAVNLMFTLVALPLIDRLGRKPLLVVASAGMGVSLTALGFAFLAGPSAGSVPLAFILCYVAFFSAGMGPGVWVVMAELFPTKIRGRAMSVATISLWLACLLITLSFLSLVRALSISGAFWLYAAMCGFTVWFVWRLMPETRGKTLEEIEREWRRGGGQNG
jgi:sugar porter (SP) family MFS transporter